MITTQKIKDGKYLTACISGGYLESLKEIMRYYGLKDESAVLAYLLDAGKRKETGVPATRYRTY